MDDLISRQAAIDTLHMDTSIIPYKKAREYADATILEIRNRLENLPSAQPTLYGYSIEHLVFIAKAMEKDGLSPEEVTNLLRDTGYAVKFVIESLKEALEKINHSE